MLLFHLSQALDYEGQEEEKEKIKTQITLLALKYGFVTPFTSLVVTQFQGDQILEEAKDERKTFILNNLVKSRQWTRIHKRVYITY